MQLPNLKQKNIHTGFTLVELIVTISIVAILGSIGMVVYSSVQRDNRDQKRLRDLRAIAQALELYRYDVHSYPSTLSFGSGSSLQNGSKVYMDPIPNDQSSGRVYQYVSSGCTGSDCTGFALCAIEEGTKSYGITPDACSTQNCGAGPCNIGISSN